MYLIDTNVLSAGAPTKAPAEPGLSDWMDRNAERLFLSVITLAEVEDGIAKARREGAMRKAARLDAWLQTVLHLYATRILPLDIPIARLLGALSDRARGLGHAPGLADLAIAATASHHGCTVLTRDLTPFRLLGIPAQDPFDSLPRDTI